jgi:uncharacterized membrane protein YgdD (TMEM256/DUF423 family)
MPFTSRRWIAIGALLGGIGVALGAYRAHGLADLLDALGYEGEDLQRRLDIFSTAVHYQMLHAIALVLTGLLVAQRRTRWWELAGWAFLIGIVLFCGLLKVMTFADSRWNGLGAIVPFGGAALIAGWIALAIGALQGQRESRSIALSETEGGARN